MASSSVLFDLALLLLLLAGLSTGLLLVIERIKLPYVQVSLPTNSYFTLFVCPIVWVRIDPFCLATISMFSLVFL